MGSNFLNLLNDRHGHDPRTFVIKVWTHKTTWHYVQKICIHMICLLCRNFPVTVTSPWFFDGIEPRVRSGPSTVLWIRQPAAG
jgi:hypothetical protein